MNASCSRRGVVELYELLEQLDRKLLGTYCTRCVHVERARVDPGGRRTTVVIVGPITCEGEGQHEDHA